MTTDLQQFRVLLAIHDSGSVTGAAHKLNMSQPAVSNALAKLRSTFDDPLFVRIANRMEATPRTLALLPRLQEVLEILDLEILSNPGFEPASSSREWIFCLSEVGEIVFLPRLFERLQQESPRASVRTISLTPDQLAPSLLEGKVDSILGYFPDLVTPDIYQQRLFSHKLSCLLRAGHPAAQQPMSLATFCQLPHLQVSNGGRSQEMYEAHLNEAGIQRNIALQTSHYLSVPSIIASSDLLVVLPRTVARLYANNPSVQVVEPPIELPPYDLKHYWHARFHKDPRSQWLRKTIQDLFTGTG